MCHLFILLFSLRLWIYRVCLFIVELGCVIYKARGYTYTKIEYVSVRMYLSKIEYVYDTFRSVH